MTFFYYDLIPISLLNDWQSISKTFMLYSFQTIVLTFAHQKYLILIKINKKTLKILIFVQFIFFYILMKKFWFCFISLIKLLFSV